MSTLPQALHDPANLTTLAQDLRFYPGISAADLEELIEFARTFQHEATPPGDRVADFMGVFTRTRFIRGHDHLGGWQEGLPYPSNFHAEAIEWSGLVKALARADKTREFVAVELGAGWGPWLVAAHHGAKARGFEKIRLVGMEADAGHFEFMRQHFVDNGIDPRGHELIQGVVAANDGVAHFPALADPSADWGAQADFNKTDGSRSNDYRGFAQDWVKVPCHGLAGLLSRFASISFLHCDIQGHEYEVLSSCFDVLKERVRTMVIGTHSRLIEGQLFDSLVAQGWTLAGEKPCKFQLDDGKPALSVDGTQVWLNSGPAR